MSTIRSIPVGATHYTCNICGYDFYEITDKRKLYVCEKCGQRYELVPSRYGGVKIIIGGKHHKETIEEG